MQVRPMLMLTLLAGSSLSALGYRFSKADIGVRCVNGSIVAASGDQICDTGPQPSTVVRGNRRRESVR